MFKRVKLEKLKCIMKFIFNSVEVSNVFENTPKRIVSLVPSQTELLYDLDLECNLVGITKFCIHPKHLKFEIQQVGGTKNVNYKKIIGLKPDIIVCNKEENTLEMVEKLSEICPVLVTDIATFTDNLYMIAYFGKLFDKQKMAKKWIDDINNEYEKFKLFIKDIPRKKVAYLIWKNPYMAVGSGTFIDEMLNLNNFENIYGNLSRYPEINLENIEMLDVPDFIFLSSEPYPFKEKDVREIESFMCNTKIFLVDGELFSWYGSRILQSFDYFKNLHQKIL